MKLLSVAGVNAGTATSGMILDFAAGGLETGVLTGVTGLAGVTFAGGVVLIVGIVLTGVALAGGVTVIPGDPIPMVRLVAHNAAMMPELMLFGFMVSTSRWCELGDYF